ncbi:MAG TPA: ThuA domain-containing protein [Planctomycetota bacterium]|jgi:type 1 glutamine amidotransferase
MNKFGLMLCMAVMAMAFQAGAEDAVKPIKVLLICGGNAHDYKNQSTLIPAGLKERINAEVTVEHPTLPTGKEIPGNTVIDLYKKPDWIKGYDIVIHNECYAEVADKDAVESIAKAHADSGVAAVVIHGSLHAYRSADKVTDEWRKLLGVTSVRHEKGGRTLEIKTVKADHPIMAGFVTPWKLDKEELYVIEKEWPNCVPLATAFAEDAKKDFTVAWANTDGKAKVFGVSLGHPNATFQNMTYMDLMARGILWACDKIDEKGQPKPGYGAKK